MKLYTYQQTADALPFKSLITQMKQLFASGVQCPDRHSHSIELANEKDGTLLIMPGWHDDIGCVKIVTVTPENGKRHLPAVAANLLVFNRHTGQHLALLDGDAVTTKRTAAASALAASVLALPSAEKLLIVGAGKIAEQLPEAFSTVRPIKTVSIWNRNYSNAQRLAQQLIEKGFIANVVKDLETGVRQADIISAATLSTEPLIKGEWLSNHQHVDLIGSFTPTMREADDEAIKKSAIYIDSDFSARESGEISIPLQNGTIQTTDILGTLYDLTSGNIARPENQPTLFKGAGNAVMDLAAAITAIQ